MCLEVPVNRNRVSIPIVNYMTDEERKYYRRHYDEKSDKIWMRALKRSIKDR